MELKKVFRRGPPDSANLSHGRSPLPEINNDLILAHRCRRGPSTPTEIDRGPTPHRQPDDAVDLLAVADAAAVLTPRHFLGVAEKIPPGDMVMVPEFAAPQAREIGFGGIGAGAVEAVGFLMVDPLHRKAGVQLVPGGALVGMQRGALGDALADRRHGRGLGGRHLNQGAPRAFAHHNDDLALARAVLAEPAVEPIGRPVLRSDVAAEIGTVALGPPPLAADAQRFHAGRHGLAQLVRQDERGLVLDVEFAAERQHALALDFVAEGAMASRYVRSGSL